MTQTPSPSPKIRSPGLTRTLSIVIEQRKIHYIVAALQTAGVTTVSEGGKVQG